MTIDEGFTVVPRSVLVHLSFHPCKNVMVPWNYNGLIRARLYGVPYFYWPKAVVTPYLTVSQTGVNSSVWVVENHEWSVAGALRKSVARSLADPGQWDWGLTAALLILLHMTFCCPIVLLSAIASWLRKRKLVTFTLARSRCNMLANR